MKLFSLAAIAALATEADALRFTPLRGAVLARGSPAMSSEPPKSNTAKLTMDVAAKIVGGAVCYRLDEVTSEEASEPFRNIARKKYSSGTWYACTGPADDMELTCFIAPTWMGLPDGQWVCSDVPIDQTDVSADDGY